MGAITSLFAYKVVRAATGLTRPGSPGLDALATHLACLDLDPDGPAEPGRMIPAGAYYAFLEAIARDLPDATALPLEVGASMRADEYGAFGLAWKTAPTLRDSLTRAERFGRLLTSVTEYSLTPIGDDLLFQLHRAGDRRLGLRLSNEASLASAIALAREGATGPVHARAVYFKHAAPPDIAAHRRYFGSEVHFRSTVDAILFPADLLDRPNRLGDPAIAGFLTAHLDRELRRIVGSEDPLTAIRQHLAAGMSAGTPTLAALARHLGLSPRTAQRRLADAGWTFQRLVDDVRADLARGLLTDTRYSLAEIAFLTGFADQSAFTRAFRRWTGRTPAAFRATGR